MAALARKSSSPTKIKNNFEKFIATLLISTISMKKNNYFVNTYFVKLCYKIDNHRKTKSDSEKVY